MHTIHRKVPHSFEIKTQGLLTLPHEVNVPNFNRCNMLSISRRIVGNVRAWKSRPLHTVPLKSTSLAPVLSMTINTFLIIHLKVSSGLRSSCLRPNLYRLLFLSSTGKKCLPGINTSKRESEAFVPMVRAPWTNSCECCCCMRLSGVVTQKSNKHCECS